MVCITIRFDSISTQKQQKTPFCIPARCSQERNTATKGSVVVKVIVVLATITATTVFPLQHAHAGIFSFLGSLLFGSEEKGIGTDESQLLRAELLTSLHTMPLLDAPMNADGAKVARGGAQLTIVDNNALLAAAGPLGSSADEEVIKTDRITLYTVREGDNISVIARMFGVTVNTILWANDIKRSDLIKPGDVLIILPISGVKYAVKKGDTLASIAKAYKGDVEEISIFNGLSTDAILAAGDEIIIPNGEILAPVPVRTSGGNRGSLAGGLPRDVVGYFMRPVVGVRSQGIHGFNGVDLAASCGSPIYASAAGTVIVSKAYGWNGGYGNYIVVTHANGTQTLYAHNTSNIVSAGQYVAQGQIIGTVGSTGRSTGCHAHFEVRGAKNPF